MRIVRHITLLSICFGLSLTTVHAQKKPNFGKPPKVSSKSKAKQTYDLPKVKTQYNAWKANRLEYTVGAGASGFLGDLGGQDDVGQPLFYDLEPTTTRYAISAGARYFIKEKSAIRGMLSYARVRGDDALTRYEKRRYRNLHFKAPIIELSGVYEFHFIRPRTLQLMGAESTRLFDGNRIGAYVYGGAGLFFFNSKSKYDGKWYALKPLHTEGQGLPGGPEPYSRFSLAFPLGGAAYILLNHNYTIGFDFGYRWTITDYIDDASGYYYNNDEINSRFGKLSAYFANPSTSLPDVPDREWYMENQPRGGSKGNDTYLFFQVTLSKPLTPSITNKPWKDAKRKKKKTYKSKKLKSSKRKFKAPKLHFGKRKKKFKINTF